MAISSTHGPSGFEEHFSARDMQVDISATPPWRKSPNKDSPVLLDVRSDRLRWSQIISTHPFYSICSAEPVQNSPNIQHLTQTHRDTNNGGID